MNGTQFGDSRWTALVALAVSSIPLGQIGCGGAPLEGAAGDPAGFRSASTTPARRGFPQHTPYAAGTIKPTNATQAQMDSVVASFYDQWKARYITATAGNQYYVHAQVWQPGAVSVSEGHGYGMVITAMMAGHDPNAQNTFDGLYRFFRAYPAYNSQLMGWYQTLSGSTVQQGSAYNATDGDLDIAFSLLLADAQWGSAGSINYLAEAKNVIQNGLMQADINRNYWSTMRGDTGQSDQSSRTSDYMLDHFRAFQAATGDANWSKVVSKLQSILSSLQANYSAGPGLPPDFVVNVGSSPAPAPANSFESAYDGDYYWNSCRTPWRVGADLVLTGDPTDAALLTKLNVFFQTATGNNPANIWDGYYLTGGTIDNWNTMAFIAPLGVAAMAGPQNQGWLNSLWSDMAGTAIANDYYGDSIRMQALIVMSGNWWAPGVGQQQQQQPPPSGPSVSLTAPGPNAAFAAPASITLTASPSGSSLSKVDFYEGGTLIGTRTAAPWTVSWSNVAAGSYSLTARVTNASGQSATSPAVAVTVASLPSPWKDQDIGAVGVAGSAADANGTFTVKGAGSNIWYTADQFNYLYQPMSGDGQIIARVASMQNTDPWAQAGVMIRETLTGPSSMGIMIVTPGAGTAFEYRTANGGAASQFWNYSASGQYPTAPMWLKLVRAGNNFTGYYSTDGTNWVAQGTISIPMTASAYVGLAVSSLNNSALNTVTFQNVAVTP